MSYTGSQAGIGLGTILSIDTSATSTPTYTLVGELNKLNLSGRQAGTTDVTNFQSSAREFKPTLISSGDWDFAGNRVGGDAGQVAMEAAFVGLKLKKFQIQLPPTGTQTVGDSFTFVALVEELNYSVEVDKAIPVQGKLKVSGILTETAGS
jgi:hypothetical protein